MSQDGYTFDEDNPRDPLVQAMRTIDGASEDLAGIRLGPLSRNDRAAIDRAKQALLAAVGRLDDVERMTRP